MAVEDVITVIEPDGKVQITVTDELIELNVIEEVAQVITVFEIPPSISSGGGGGSGDKNYPHVQLVPSTVWVVNHNLGKEPTTEIIDSSGERVQADVYHNSLNQLTITFAYAITGRASCN